METESDVEIVSTGSEYVPTGEEGEETESSGEEDTESDVEESPTREEGERAGRGWSPVREGEAQVIGGRETRESSPESTGSREAAEIYRLGQMEDPNMLTWWRQGWEEERPHARRANRDALERRWIRGGWWRDADRGTVQEREIQRGRWWRLRYERDRRGVRRPRRSPGYKREEDMERQRRERERERRLARQGEREVALQRHYQLRCR